MTREQIDNLNNHSLANALERMADGLMIGGIPNAPVDDLMVTIWTLRAAARRLDLGYRRKMPDETLRADWPPDSGRLT